jgi:hypothetical protein
MAIFNGEVTFKVTFKDLGVSTGLGMTHAIIMHKCATQVGLKSPWTKLDKDLKDERFVVEIVKTKINNSLYDVKEENFKSNLKLLTMKNILILLTIGIFFFQTKNMNAQPDQDEMGGWYMYFFNTTFNESPWGVQGDIQLRNWNIDGDMEQLLLRGGLTYSPDMADIKVTLGYGNISTGVYGPDKSTSSESRIYQEVLFPVKFGNRIYTNHRFRYEQRFVEDQEFRTRYRYNLFLNIALNNAEMEKKTLYLALYNELFINGQRNIGNENTVEIFDRNRFYCALGYVIKPGRKVQLGVMKQTTDNWSKNQLQLSFHQKI